MSRAKLLLLLVMSDIKIRLLSPDINIEIFIWLEKLHLRLMSYSSLKSAKYMQCYATLKFVNGRRRAVSVKLRSSFY